MFLKKFSGLLSNLKKKKKKNDDFLEYPTCILPKSVVIIVQKCKPLE